MECKECGSKTRSVGKSFEFLDDGTQKETAEYFYCEECKTYTEKELS